MLFTLFYAYATVMQWWRLRTLGSKLKGTLSDQNALLICSGVSIQDRKKRSLENLLFKTDTRIACTVVPKQKLNLSQWIAFPKNLRYFPIYIQDNKLNVKNGIFVLVQAVLDSYVRHQSAIIQIENFGELVGWKVGDFFEVVVRTDVDLLTKLIFQFSQCEVDVNHELKLFKIETVDVEGQPTVIKYDKKYLKSQLLNYSYSPVHWKAFVTEVKELYSKIHDVTNPKIKIENGSTKSFEISKPKKEEKTKNTLEVGAVPKTKKVSEEEKSKSPLDASKSKSKEEKSKNTLTKAKKTEEKSKEDKTKNTLEVSEHRRHKKKETVKNKEVKNKTKNEERPKHKRSANKLVKQSSVKDAESEMKDDPDSGCHSDSLTLGKSKPPNVLVYADSLVTKENVKRVLFSILNKERYTIYDLPSTSQMGWDKSTVLVVVCGSLPPDLTSNVIHYFLTGGKLLCICSDLMYSVLYTFATAEVREHELVRFTYGPWERVKMMHHVFCYQASPAKKQFSKDSDHSNHNSSNGSSPLAPRTPSKVELRHNDKDYNIQVQVLGAEETWQTPSLLLAKVKGSQGRAVFSQVHLEIDPEVYENDQDKYRSLLSSNEARLEILKDLLDKHLEMECDEGFGKVEYTPGYFLGRFDAKVDMLAHCESIANSQLTCDRISVAFCGHNVNPGVASDIRLPVLIHSCPSNFSTLEYFENLETEDIGRLVIYSDILTSSQHVISKKLRHGLVIIPRQQTSGVGRSSNSWITPIGGAAFSLQMHIPLDSTMGGRLSMIQHLIMVAVISAVKNHGYEELQIGIKWPNDLYADSSVKIGGVVVNSIIYENVAIVNIGCGVNLFNQNPTICLNDLIESNPNLKPISYEKFFALVFNEIEKFYLEVQNKGFDNLLDLYYKYWLHSDAPITILSESGQSQNATILGVDQYGFLSVRLADGSTTSLQPDGNTFDMMKGLIAPKKF